LVAGSAEARADVRFYKETVLGLQVIEIHGVIQPNDVPRLATILQTAGPGAVKLNSPGGDVRVAMALGRILRKERRSVVMGPDEQCVSACVFVLAGAVDRGVYSEKVGIHRPFLTRDAATTAQQQKDQYADIETLVKSYLAEMNVDQRLYDDMLRVSPLQVRYLTEDELKAYGLFGKDPYVEQANLARRAQQLRISTDELLRRWHAGVAPCGAESWKCFDAIEAGISLDEYYRREALSRRVCASDGREWDGCYDLVIRGEKK
jgi:hypothetical protein